MSRAFRLGLFISSSLLILAVGIFLIGDRHFLFSPAFHVQATFKSASGLDEGAEVRVGGIHQGTVTEVTLPPRPDGNVTVWMKIDRHSASVLRSDSVASIQTEGLLGMKYVNLSFGSDGAPPLKNGATLASREPLDLSELMQQANELLANAKDASASVKGIAAKIDAGQGTLGALVNDKTMYTQLGQATAQAKGAAAAFGEDAEALKHNFFLRGFFNNRGYEDESKIGEHLIAKLPEQAPLRTFRYDVGKIFEDAEHAKLKSAKTLNDAGMFLQATPFTMAVVVAEGGMKGDADEVRLLTQARAMVVREYLVDNFKMDDTRVRTLGLGKSKEPSGDGSIEILVYGRSGAPPGR